MPESDETAIGFSKKKQLLLLLGAAAFVLVGFWMLTTDNPSSSSFRRYPPLVVRGIGLASVLFFGAAGIMGVKQLFESRPGLVLNASGFVDSASAAAAGSVPWSDVVGIEGFGVQGQKMLVVRVSNPEAYTARGPAWKRKAAEANQTLCGSPIAIPSVTLAIRFSRLEALFADYLRKYGKVPDTTGDRISARP